MKVKPEILIWSITLMFLHFEHAEIYSESLTISTASDSIACYVQAIF